MIGTLANANSQQITIQTIKKCKKHLHGSHGWPLKLAVGKSQIISLTVMVLLSKAQNGITNALFQYK